jgi:hypothetical protein
MDDIINYCIVLNSLTIIYGHILHTETFDPESPHFRNLKKLRLSHNWGPFDFCPILHLYGNLNVLRVVGMIQLTDMSINNIVGAGGFSHVTEFVVVRCGNMSVYTALLIMLKCPNLTKLGNIDSWSDVTSAHVVTLLNYIKHNNLSVTICR